MGEGDLTELLARVRQIGQFVPAYALGDNHVLGTAKSLAKRLDAGEKISGRVHSLFAPDEMNHPRVTIELDY
jgi:hypothetical protein